MRHCGEVEAEINLDGDLEKIEEYSVRDNQKDAKIKDINYIQNFIFIAR